MKKVSLRTIVQVTIFFVVIFLAFAHQKFGIEKFASIDAYCPFGAVESFFTLIFKGEFLKRIFTSAFILLGIFLVATIFFGRVFCGYFCPLGALQEWIRKMGEKIGIKKTIEIPESYDKYLRYVKYLVLAVIVYFSFYLGDLVFRNYDPYTALMHFGQELDEKIIGYSVLGVIVIGSFFSKNLWCRYFCPLGAFLGIVKKFSFFKIKRNEKSCISCGICDKNCPANLNISSEKAVNSSDCISCGKCVSNCPKSSLKFNIMGKEISKKKFSALVILLVFVPLMIAPLTPFWKTKPESNIVNTKGEVNVDDIRGSNTLKYVIETTGLPLHKFQKELGLPKDIDLDMKLKDIGPTYNLKNKDGNILETEDFREVVSRETTIK